MKKILFLFLLLPVMVFADEECKRPVDKVNSSGSANSKSLTLSCDVNNLKAGVLSTDKGAYKEVIKVNTTDVKACTITCSEEILYSIEPIKKVIAGTSFRYPLYYRATRQCNAEYHYKDYDEGLRNAIDSKNTNLIANYISAKKNCDNFINDEGDGSRKYEVKNGEFYISIDAKNGALDNKKLKKTVEDYYNYNNVFDTYYEACEYKNESCNEVGKVTSGWTQTSTEYGKYTLDDAYLELYTGKLVSKLASADKCNAGDRFFTDLNEPTTIIQSSGIYNYLDGGNEIKIVSNKDKTLSNLSTASNKINWTFSASCKYHVKNLTNIENGTGTGESGGGDDNSNSFGFRYRPVDLSNPFPNTTPANWAIYIKNHSTGIDIFKQTLDYKFDSTHSSLYTINLNRYSMSKIKNYEKFGYGFGITNQELKTNADGTNNFVRCSNMFMINGKNIECK